MLWRSESQPGRIVTTGAVCLNLSWTRQRARSQWPLLQATTLSAGGIGKVSTSTAIAEAAERDLESKRSKVPFKSPTYPVRSHFGERAELEERLRACEERIQSVRQKLDSPGNQPDRGARERLYFQMLGARDQVAEAVRRLPLETGALYDEDRERYEEALAAFERTVRRWQGEGR